MIILNCYDLDIIEIFTSCVLTHRVIIFYSVRSSSIKQLFDNLEALYLKKENNLKITNRF